MRKLIVALGGLFVLAVAIAWDAAVKMGRAIEEGI